MKKIKLFVCLFFSVLATGLMGCNTNNLIDTNEEMPQRNWSYVNKIKGIAEIKDPAKPVSLRFKLRHTADYRYSNIYILMTLSGPGLPKITRRYEYKLAESDGQWLGKGSGNLYTYVLPLLTNYNFPASGKYNIEIEQNMRDNPLKEISDVGIMVSGVPEK
ncbi:gliding motility-associated lipoprotein GldH [Pedobacter cryoconitis]|uniref:gliding motility lipoprotein GldH n=1 Tax=Pedobacter cryoconitis TaxID=188932 RepID=UPI001609C965|nr:gliding motility lipoprotein GldH [Pedobacter cryoconitis]MBB6273576.1 gliding motility-associated lipoprotein GldH [Pedobacter cryoconitis]